MKMFYKPSAFGLPLVLALMLLLLAACSEPVDREALLRERANAYADAVMARDWQTTIDFERDEHGAAPEAITYFRQKDREFPMNTLELLSVEIQEDGTGLVIWDAMLPIPLPSQTILAPRRVQSAWDWSDDTWYHRQSTIHSAPATPESEAGQPAEAN